MDDRKFKKGRVTFLLGIPFMAIFLHTALASGDVQAGKRIFSANCISCHGKNGNGKGPLAVGLSPPPADFTDPDFWNGKTDSFLIHVIQNGLGSMPSWSDSLTPQNIEDVLSYIKTLKK